MNRRQFLTFSASTAGVMVLGSLAGAAVVFEDSYTYIPALIREFIGDFRMDPIQQQGFIDAFAQDYGAEKLVAVIGLHRIRARTGLGVAYTDHKLEQFERQLMTAFLVSSDYLRQSERSNPQLSFSGYKLPCSNPYARFS